MRFDKGQQWLTVLFLVTAFCFFFRSAIFGEFYELAVVRYVTKALPVALLAVVVACRSRSLTPVALALALSAAGDIAGEVRAFLWQVALFMAAHLCYIVAFWRGRRQWQRSNLLWSAAVWVPLAIFAVVVIPCVTSCAERTASLLYLGVIGTMATLAVWHRSPDRWAYCTAALLFCASDAMIAYGRFVEKFAYSGIAIMATYFAAQYLFAIAELRRISTTR